MQVKHNGTDNIDAMKLKNAGIGEGTAQTSAQAERGFCNEVSSKPFGWGHLRWEAFFLLWHIVCTIVCCIGKCYNVFLWLK